MKKMTVTREVRRIIGKLRFRICAVIAPSPASSVEVGGASFRSARPSPTSSQLAVNYFAQAARAETWFAATMAECESTCSSRLGGAMFDSCDCR